MKKIEKYLNGIESLNRQKNNSINKYDIKISKKENVLIGYAQHHYTPPYMQKLRQEVYERGWECEQREIDDLIGALNNGNITTYDIQKIHAIEKKYGNDILPGINFTVYTNEERGTNDD